MASEIINMTFSPLRGAENLSFWIQWNGMVELAQSILYMKYTLHAIILYSVATQSPHKNSL